MQNDKKIDEVKEAWLDSQKMPTKRYYRDWFGRFEEFTKMTATEILAARKADKEYAWEAKLLTFKSWLQNEQKLSDYSATAIAMAVRGFFSFYRVPLQFRRSESKRISQKSRTTEDYKFNLEDLKKVYEVSDLEERYIVTAGKSFGLRAGDFIKLTRGQLQPYIDREPPISIGEIKTEKEDVKAYPFIDTDAAPIIKLMLQQVDKKGKTKPSDRMLSFRQEIQVTRVLQRLVARAGIEVGSKRVRFHCLRKFLSDHLSSHMSESKWKQIVGKSISEGAYISADELRKDYARAMVETTFATQRQVEDRLKALEDFKKTLTPEQQEAAKRAGFLMRKKERVSKPEDCEDGQHCGEEFKQIADGKLLGYLREGWTMEYRLEKGQVIVKRG